MLVKIMEYAPRRALLCWLLLAGAGCWLLAMPALAATEGGQDIDWLQLGMGLFGGLALFLFGMDQMSDGLKAAAGDSLKNVLAKLTSNRFSGALTGAFVTAILNSSSVTTVLVVGFITAGIMNLAQSIGVIMGANIGSTFTAQIVAFNITQYALLPVAIGFLMLFTAKQDKIRYYGMMVMGLGLVFFGMGVMSQAMNPLRTYQPFLDLMQTMENPLLGILVGAVFTALVQSSAATTGIAIVMASEGLLSLPAGIALALGSNVGTCATAMLASIGKPTEAVRAAVAHVVFNVAGVVLWVGLIHYLADLVTWMSPSYPELEGAARSAKEVPRQIANAHTSFNVINTFLFIGFTTQLARLVEWLVPAKAPKAGVIVAPKYLDPAATTVPALALEQVRLEFGHMGAITQTMFDGFTPAIRQRDTSLLKEIILRDDQVDILHDAIMQYMQTLRSEELNEEQSREFAQLLSATDNLESIADTVEIELGQVAQQFIDKDVHLSPQSQELFQDLLAAVSTALADAVQAVRDNDQEAAQRVMSVKGDVRRISDSFVEFKAQRLVQESPDYLLRLRLEMTAADQIRRVYTLAKRIAKTALPAELADQE
jgi:phosphate:Na+ symporter